MLGKQRRVRAVHALHDRLERGRIEDAPVAKRIDQHGRRIRAHADHHMPRHVQRVRRPVQPPRRRDVQHRKADGQAAPAIDHADEIGIGGIVIRLGIAREAEFRADYTRQHPRALGARARRAAEIGQPLGDRRKHRDIGREIDLGMIERRKLERGDIEKDLAILDEAQVRDGVVHGG